MNNKYFFGKLLVVLIFFLSANIFAQITFKSVNAGLSIGAIYGNSPSITSFGGKISTDFNLWFSDEITFQAGFEHARRVEYFLPENRTNKDYPFVNYYFLKASIKQPFYKKLFLEEGIGLIVLNDRTYSDTNIWEYGGMFSLACGIDFRENIDSGFTLSAGINYGITINSTSAGFSLISFQTNYYF